MKIYIVIFFITSFVSCSPYHVETSHSDSTYIIPESIDFTGNKDVGNLINKFFRNVPNGSTVIFRKNGIYKSESIIKIYNKSNLKIIGNGATIISETDGSGLKSPSGKPAYNWPRSRHHIDIMDCDNIVLTGINIVGANSRGGIGREAYVKRLEAQHGINITGGNNIMVDSVSIKNVYGDFIYIGHGAGNKISRNVSIMNSYFSHNGRQGIAITMADSVSILNNKIDNVRMTSIDIEPNMSKSIVRNVYIRNNSFGAGRLMWIGINGRGHVRNVYIEDNHLPGRNGQIMLGNSNLLVQNVVMKNNVSERPAGNPQGAIWKINNVSGFYAEGNVMPAQANRNMYLIGQRNSEIFLGNNVIHNGLNRKKDFD